MTEVFFNGPEGRIEGQYAPSKNYDAPVALVLHPHPLYGGTMNNKVVYNVYKTLFENGMNVLRINFRGVGRSLGTFDSGVGEMADAATALDWLQSKHPLSQVNLIAGFSFGAWIAMQLIMRRPEITNFIALSPPINKHDFSFFTPCPIPGLIIQGDQDTVVSEESVYDIVQKFFKQKSVKIDYSVIHGGDHFFRDKISDVNSEITSYLKKIIQRDSTEKKSTSPKKVFLM